MDPVELVRDPSLSGSATAEKGGTGVASVGSYSEPVIVPNDSGSVSSGPIHGGAVPQSPARSNPSSVHSSPAQGPMATATPAPHAFIPQPSQGVDLLGTHDPQLYPAVRQRSNHEFMSSEDDDETEPSSSATGNTTTIPPNNSQATSTFGRLINLSKRRLNPGKRKSGNNSDDDDDDDDENFLDNALIYGYLQKLGRNGKWQTRWFETDGEHLTYYKSSKRIKLLATLDLAQVGSISINYPDSSGTTFTISISKRPYHLRADSKAACKDWVITLNRVKEARMQEGNVKLSIRSNQPIDLLDQDFTPRVVVVANRQRTRAVDVDEIESWNNDPANPANNEFSSPSSKRLARWQKPGHSLKRLANKLVRWARSIRKYGCTDAENQVMLDRHLHPPGHDDLPPTTPTKAPPDLINVETAPQTVAGTEGAPGTTNEVDDDEDDGVRHLS